MSSPTLSGVARPPFRLNTPPHEAFVHPSWQRAEDVTIACLAEGDRVLLLGAAGTGKTMLLNQICRRLRDGGTTVITVRNGYVPETVAGSAVMMIDEADTLPDASWQRLREMSNPAVLAGLPGLREKVGREIGVVGAVTLERLSPEEVARFVRARLAASDRSASLFSPDAVKALVEQSGGLFRVLMILAGASLFFAELRGAPEVAAADVAEAVSMRTIVGELAPAEPAFERSPAPPATRPGLVPLLRTQFSMGALLAVLATTCAAVAALGSQIAWSAREHATSAVLIAPEAPPPRSASTQLAFAAAPVVPTEPPPQAEAKPAAVSSVAAVRRVSGLSFAGLLKAAPAGEMDDREGTMVLRFRSDGEAGKLTARVHGADGLVLSGRLSGGLSNDGVMTLTGRMFVGHRRFECTLEAHLDGDRIIGEAIFRRTSNGISARRSFILTRT